MTEHAEARDIFNQIAWRDFIAFAWFQDDIRRQFETETGIVLCVAPTPLDAMIDQATGMEELKMRRFVLWVTKRHWGAEFAPAALREKIEAGEELA